jgi:hypothetical protein
VQEWTISGFSGLLLAGTLYTLLRARKVPVKVPGDVRESGCKIPISRPRINPCEKPELPIEAALSV